MEERNVEDRRKDLEEFACKNKGNMLDMSDKSDFNVLATKYYDLLCLKICLNSLKGWKTKALQLIEHFIKANKEKKKSEQVEF
jgi:hypothetical protein